jgi:hypothetical protein
MVVNEDEIGAAVIRLQHDNATEGDLDAVIRMVLKSAAFRERCQLLGHIAKHLPERKRQENAEAMACVAFCKHGPMEEISASQEEKEKWPKATPVFIIQAAPAKDNKWEDHLLAQYAKSNRASWARLSPYAQAIVRAVEEMWGVKGHLLGET